MGGRSIEFGVRPGSDYDQEINGDDLVRLHLISNCNKFMIFTSKYQRWTYNVEDKVDKVIAKDWEQIKIESIGDVISMQ